MASPQFGELVTTTLFRQTPEWADNFTNNLALMFRLKQKGKIKKVDGGYEIRKPLMYAFNGTFKWMTGYEEFDLTPQEVLDAAKYQWKLAGVAVVFSGFERRQNSGSKTQLFDWIEARMEVARKSMLNGLDVGVQSDGTANGGKQIGGLQYLFSTTANSGTVAGINKATWSFWQHNYRSTATSTGAARTSANIKSEYNACMTPVVRSGEQVDLILAGDTDYNSLLEAMQAQQIMKDPKLAEAGFETLKYRSADVVLAGGKGTHQTATTSYLLQTDYIDLTAHEECYITALEPETRASLNQDAFARLIGFMGNLTCSNMALQTRLDA